MVPAPIMSVANLSSHRVRVEVDERDLDRIHLRQAVRIKSDAWGESMQTGKVVSMAWMMGKKAIAGPRPEEMADREVREVWVEMDTAAATQVAVVGLRVVVEFVE